MQPFRELSLAQKSIEIGRWVLLVPLAGLVGAILHSLVGIVFRAIPGRGGMESVSFWVRTIPTYVLPQMALVIISAWMAPRKPLLAALLLTLFFGALSLMKHVVVQTLVGNTIGTINYVHFGLESAGLLVGLLCVHRWAAHQRIP